MIGLSPADATLKVTVTPPRHTKLKPIFHCKLGLRWLPNANEINTKNMKCTWPTPAPFVGDPTPPIFHLVALGVTQILAFAFGLTQILEFLDTNMLVYPTRNCGVGGLSQRQDPTQMVLRRSRYRLKFFIDSICDIKTTPTHTQIEGSSAKSCHALKSEGIPNELERVLGQSHSPK